MFLNSLLHQPFDQLFLIFQFCSSIDFFSLRCSHRFLSYSINSSKIPWKFSHLTFYCHSNISNQQIFDRFSRLKLNFLRSASFILDSNGDFSFLLDEKFDLLFSSLEVAEFSLRSRALAIEFSSIEQIYFSLFPILFRMISTRNSLKLLKLNGEIDEFLSGSIQNLSRIHFEERINEMFREKLRKFREKQWREESEIKITEEEKNYQTLLDNERKIIFQNWENSHSNHLKNPQIKNLMNFRLNYENSQTSMNLMKTSQFSKLEEFHSSSFSISQFSFLFSLKFQLKILKLKRTTMGIMNSLMNFNNQNNNNFINSNSLNSSNSNQTFTVDWNFPRLESFELSGFLFPFPSSFPQLKSLILLTLNLPISFENLLENIFNSAPLIENLEIQGVEPYFFRTKFPPFSQLKRLNIFDLHGLLGDLERVKQSLKENFLIQNFETKQRWTEIQVKIKKIN